MIKYPFLTKDEMKKEVHYANRGLSFESRINKTNEYYKNADIALVYKRPTPIKVISTDEEDHTINKAVYSKKSTTDYNGVFQGHYIDFEAKSTNNITSFPLKNIAEHQLIHLLDVDYHGGLSFFLIEFNKLDEIYLIKATDVAYFIDHNKSKSIPLKYIKEKGFLVHSTIKAYVDYLENFEKIWGISKVFYKK